MQHKIPIISLLSLVCLAGCATHADVAQTIRSDFFAGRIQDSARTINERIEKDEKDRDVLKLDRGIIELVSANPKAAERTFRGVRNRFDSLEQSDIGEWSASLISDDTRIAYAGEDYEKILLRTFLALSNLMTDGADAFAYSHQVTAKQNQIIEDGADPTGNNPKLAYKRVALGPYLEAALREETHSSFDDVERSIRLVSNWEPTFRYAQADLQRARFGRHSSPGNGVLYVFAMVGRGPYKVESIEVPSSVALLIVDRILANNSNYSVPPTIAPIKVPKIKLANNVIRKIQVGVDGETRGTTETVTDIGQLAVQQNLATRNQTVARAVVRRIVKKGILNVGSRVVNKSQDPLANFALDLVGVAWEASEAADTRCWGLLPDKIQVLRIELPAGKHQLQLQPYDGSKSYGTMATSTIQIDDGRNTYLLAYFPVDRLVGQILSNQIVNASAE